jgi:uncharacterized repeat protein (TIGR03803 family)
MGHRLVPSAVVSSALLALVGVARVSSGQSGFEVVHAFPGSAGYPVSRLLQADDGVLYGTVPTGGPAAAGLVFALRPTPGGGVQSVVLHVFDGTDGSVPIGDLIQARDGALYGTTSGEAGGAGTVFKITTAGQLTTLHRFSGGDGLRPTGGLVQAPDGSFWGTTQAGGAAGLGTIFGITPAGALSTVHSFAGPDGLAPTAGLLLASDGNFYGTTTIDFSGGTSFDSGTVYQITPQGAFTTLHSFVWSLADPSGGKNPFAALVEGRDGDLYGMARVFIGGPSLAFSLSKSGVFTPLATIDSVVGGLTLGSDGNFYGVSTGGGDANMGTVFRMTPSGAVTTLHSFVGADGLQPFAPLVQARDGAFYGTTFRGGSANHGTIFRLATAGDFTSLGSFASRDGDSPQGSLILADGSLYGTTASGGPTDQGTVFRMSPSGAVTFLHFFSGTDGASPIAGLVQASDGALYGNASKGGASGRGTVFKITPDGVFTLIHSFADGEGRLPSSPLAEAADGNLYGTTPFGGSRDTGTAYRVTPTGEFSTLSDFSGVDAIGSCCNGPAFPSGQLAPASDGNIYGTSGGVGPGIGGTIFRMNTLGHVEVLHSFGCNPVATTQPACPDGSSPKAGPVLGRDGHFYGTTNGPGAVVFRFDTGGNYTVLHRFGDDPGVRGVIQAADGNLYGTAAGSTHFIYRITPDGASTTLHTLNPAEGAGSLAPLLQMPDGSLYGTASEQGPAFHGTAFRLAPGP